MARFLLTRLGLALITLFLLSILVFAAAEIFPGDVASKILGPTADARAIAALNSELGTRHARADQVPALHRRVLPRGPRRLLHLPDAGRSAAAGRDPELAQTSCGRAPHRGPAGDRRRDRGRASERDPGGPHDHQSRTGGDGRPGVRLRDRGPARLRGLAQRPAGDRDGANGQRAAHPGEVPDPPDDPAGVRAVRLHRPGHACRRRRGARLGLRPHGHPQGPAQEDRHPSPRPAQRPPAHGHGGRDPDRVPVRRSGGHRDPLQLPRGSGCSSSMPRAARTFRSWRAASSSSASSTSP